MHSQWFFDYFNSNESNLHKKAFTEVMLEELAKLGNWNISTSSSAEARSMIFALFDNKEGGGRDLVVHSWVREILLILKHVNIHPATLLCNIYF